ncbi:hypothetical protein C9J85_00620 [Haloferax sp. wsp5]|nr:hypothetical protein C9J85_00620 [Haloferax sp. wsp5]
MNCAPREFSHEPPDCNDQTVLTRKAVLFCQTCGGVCHPRSLLLLVSMSFRARCHTCCVHALGLAGFNSPRDRGLSEVCVRQKCVGWDLNRTETVLAHARSRAATRRFPLRAAQMPLRGVGFVENAVGLGFEPRIP